MAILKCKMCGGDLNLFEGQTVCECEYCGSKQTVPTLDNEKKLTLFSRANRLRALCEFDKAYIVYESIVSDFPEEAEAYWGLVLCKYGIEYVDDPATGKKIPTCHRSSFDPVLEDGNFELVMEYADTLARSVYRAEAKEIERLRSGILEVSAKEQPYDFFICYKETDENGDRTIDSVIAQDVYSALTEKGYRVFFSRITLEDKLGQEYEPYIFAALHSAKVMLVFGTDYEYFNAVWVKNEWSRFLSLIAKGEKKTLIPCYKNVDAYDMPQEFRRLQAQDMGKVGAIQDLLRGIEKILPRAKAETVKETVVVQQASAAQGSTVASLLKRAFMFLEDGDWKSADEYCEKVLDIDPENGEAYLGKLMAEKKVKTQEKLKYSTRAIRGSNNYIKALNYGSPELKMWLTQTAEDIRVRLDKVQKQVEEERKRQAEENNRKTYMEADKLSRSDNIDDLKTAIYLFKSIPAYQDAEKREEECLSKIQEIEKQNAEQEKQQRKITVNANALTRNLIAVGYRHAVGVKSNGTVVATTYRDSNYEGQCDVSNWNDIIAVAAGESHTVGLKGDGTVVAVGRNDEGQCNVAAWKDIVAIAASKDYTLGLRRDGTVVATEDQGHELLRRTYEYGQCNVSDWSHIVSLATFDDHTIGLRDDGTVVATGKNAFGQCNVENWKHIVAIATESTYTLGLREDGTAVSTIEDLPLSENIAAFATTATTYITGMGSVISNAFHTGMKEWTDIVAVFESTSTQAYPSRYGIKKDGSVVVDQNPKGDNYGQWETRKWKLFDNIEELETRQKERARRKAEVKHLRQVIVDQLKRLEKRKRAEAIFELQQKIEAVQKHRQSAETELANLRGLFTGRRRKELETQISQIAADIERLQTELKQIED